MAANSHVFHWLDYVIFAASLGMGLVIGVYYGFAGKRQKSTEDFLMGGRKVSVVPMALSIEATFMSAIIILGGTAEVYSSGTMMFTWTLSDFISLPLLVLIFVPFFRRNPYAVSGYEVRITSEFMS
jgi:Na+/proline symporter